MEIDKLDIKFISKTDENSDNELNKLYNELYNSLGVEPGLLSKTTIGKNLNDKFKEKQRDDSIIAIIDSMITLSK